MFEKTVKQDKKCQRTKIRGQDSPCPTPKEATYASFESAVPANDRKHQAETRDDNEDGYGKVAIKNRHRKQLHHTSRLGMDKNRQTNMVRRHKESANSPNPFQKIKMEAWLFFPRYGHGCV